MPDAELELVGSWQLAEAKRASLPASVRHVPACSREELQQRYQGADVFVFPSHFEGFGLVILEAMASGLPIIATEATAAPDILDDSTGRIVQTGDVDELVETLRWFSANRHKLSTMKAAARERAEGCTWEAYRQAVADAVAPFV